MLYKNATLFYQFCKLFYFTIVPLYYISVLKWWVTLSNKSEILEQGVKLRKPGTEKFRPDSLVVCYTIFRTDSRYHHSGTEC